MIGRTQEKGYAIVDLTFSDTASIPAYATYYIQTMAAQGVISGYADGTFQPRSQHHPGSDGQDPLQPDVSFAFQRPAHPRRPLPYGERLFGICRVLQSAIDSNPL